MENTEIDVIDLLKRDRYFAQVEREQRIADGEFIWMEYSAWCFIFKHEENTESFAEYLKENNVELTHRQRKAILEKHFGYKGVWNSEKGKWEFVKGE